MKKFTFSLDRVMDWRRTRVRIEEATLERLHAELRGIESAIAEKRLLREQSEKAIVGAAFASGAELRDLDAFKKASDVEIAKLMGTLAETRKRVAAQMEVLTIKRRDLRLLENLRERRLNHWRADLDREIDNEAAELYLVSLAVKEGAASRRIRS